MQDCTVSVPPLADIDIVTVSRVLYGDYSIAGKQLLSWHLAHCETLC